VIRENKEVLIMIYVFGCGSIVYDGNIITEEQKAQAVAVEGLPEPYKSELSA
jgi:hypothetical protein